MWIRDDGSFFSFLPEQPQRNNVPDEVFAIYLTPPGPTMPTSKADCKNAGYKSFGFENQDRCIKAVIHAE